MNKFFAKELDSEFKRASERNYDSNSIRSIEIIPLGFGTSKSLWGRTRLTVLASSQYKNLPARLINNYLFKSKR